MEKRMLAKKLEFSNEVVRIVQDIAQVVFNIKTEEQMKNIFGINQEAIKAIVNQISDTLPDHIFQPRYRSKLEELKSICARELIFFQVQERFEADDYATNLSNFIHIFSRDMQKRFG